jgi:prepilin-type processing-associated H-X9-DG protein
MLVVIAIIVVLAGLALPAILRARESSRSAQCLSNLRQLGIAITTYYETNGCYPPYRIEDPTYFNKFGVNRPRWQWLMSDFLGRPAQNPDMIRAAGTADPTYTSVPLDLEILLCPSLTTADSLSIRNGSYGYNFQYLGNSRNLVDGDITTPYLNFPIRSVYDPARTIAFGDSRGGNIPHGGHSMTLDPPHMRKRPAGSGNVSSPSPMTLPGFDPYGPDETGTDIVIYFSPAEARHRGRANVVFLDGHCETRTLDALGYVVVGGVAQPQTTTTLPWGNNALFTGWGRDETSAYFGVE